MILYSSFSLHKETSPMNSLRSCRASCLLLPITSPIKMCRRAITISHTLKLKSRTVCITPHGTSGFVSILMIHNKALKSSDNIYKDVLQSHRQSRARAPRSRISCISAVDTTSFVSPLLKHLVALP